MPRTSDEAYAELIRRVKAVSLLHSSGSLLHWDQQTYMPPRGSAHRAEQLPLVAGLAHNQFTAPEIGELLSQAESVALKQAPRSVEAVNVREIRGAYERATRVPAKLVEELAPSSRGRGWRRDGLHRARDLSRMATADDQPDESGP